MQSRYRKRIGLTAAVSLALIASPPVATIAAPANSLRELWTELNACLAAANASPGVDLTIVFSFKRNGALLGKPRITHSKLPDGPDAERSVAGSVARAMDKCLPLSITDSLGGAIAGRPLAVRIVGRKKGTDT